MKKLLVFFIVFFQLFGLCAVGLARADFQSLVSDENSKSVRTCGGLMNVVYENTVDSMRNLAEIAGLVKHPIKHDKAPTKPQRDDASTTPAIIMQAPKTVSATRLGLMFFAQPVIERLPATVDTGQCVFRCMLLLFTGFYLSLYRRKLSKIQAVNGINHTRVFFPAVFYLPRFVNLTNRGFSMS